MSLEALENRTVFTVHRHYFYSFGCGPVHHHLPRHYQGLFVGQGDVILAAEGAVFAGAPLAEGVPFEDLLYQRRRLAMPLAELLVLSGGGWTIDAARAYEVGWVSELTSLDRLLARAGEIAAAIARNDPAAVQRTKEILIRGRDLFTRDAVEQARAAVLPLDRNRAALAAILARG